MQMAQFGKPYTGVEREQDCRIEEAAAVVPASGQHTVNLVRSQSASHVFACPHHLHVRLEIGPKTVLSHDGA